MSKKRNAAQSTATASSRSGLAVLIGGGVLFVVAVVYAVGGFGWLAGDGGTATRNGGRNDSGYQPVEKWLQRSYLIDALFHKVYTAGWEGANGAIGDAHLFAITGDSTLLRFHTEVHPMRDLFNGTWVDDRAWAALAELYWWDFTGRKRKELVESAELRYMEAKMQGRLSNH
jgi:hypothetical protein